MPNIAYYISSHGYGHAARQQAVINQLARRGVAVHVRTATPPKFFQSARSLHHARYDIGMIQADALHFDIPASLQWMVDFLDAQAPLIAQEVAFLHVQKIDLVVSDMPAIACEIAERAGVPSVVVTHFTWDWVYAHYSADYPQAEPIVEALRAQYSQATLALQMQIPYPHPFDAFPTVEPVGLIHNPATRTREAVRAEFNIPPDQALVLLSMGGHRWGHSNIQTLKQQTGAVFLVMPDAWEQVSDHPERFRPVPMDYPAYHNLIAAADVLVGKAGGSTVAEVIGHRTPMIYTTQHAAQWRESELLARTLTDHASAHYVPLNDFIAGHWVDDLPNVLHADHHWSDIARDGASQTAARLLQLITDGC
ncbi:MAG: hypothetical protein ACFE0Q_00880 [Anaerolineae bacterium]